MTTADTLFVKRGAGNPQRVVHGQTCTEFVAQLEGRGFQLAVWPVDTDVTREMANQVLQSADPAHYARHRIDERRTGYVFWSGAGYTEVVCEDGRVARWAFAGELDLLIERDHVGWTVGFPRRTDEGTTDVSPRP